MNLETKRVKLRKPRISDANFISRCSKDAEITKYTSIAPPPYGIKEARQFIRGIQKRMRKKKSFHFGLELKANKELIGIVVLKDVNFKNKNVSFGIWLIKKYWGKGLTKEAAKLIFNFGFKKLKLIRIEAKILHKNIRSQNLLETIDFKYEGKLRKKTFFKNRWYDDLIYGLLKEEYQRIRKSKTNKLNNSANIL